MSHDRLWAWVHGEEDDEALRAETAGHVEQCDSCRLHVEEMRAILGDLDDMPAADPAASTTKLPERIGSYRIVRMIGRGGMGVVYEAEQQDPRRTVALKIILGGSHVDDQQIKLFRREVQTLARLNHPAIASIYESGRTEDGQHFFAMELVQGADLIDYAGHRMSAAPRAPLTFRDRLLLVQRICDAVNYAHQRGVIHRDLKPSNILVDADGNPKILDFGLARIIEGDSAEPTINTETGRVLGTLPYMSPEQAQGRPDEIDVRTDVYALGVIFYEIMTGARPYDVSRVSLVESVRIICEQSPTHPQAVNRELPDDVATIISKALEKEPERRYQSAAALGEDIDRFLAGHTILARPPSTINQIRKLVGRHRLPSALIVGLLLSIMGTGIVAVVMARDKAEEAQQKSKVADFYKLIFSGANVSDTGRRDATILDAIDLAAADIESELKDEPLVAATVRNTMGNVYTSWSELDKAEEHLTFALATRRRELGNDHRDTAESMNDLGVLRYHQGDAEAAERLWQEALAVRRKLFDENDEAIAVILNNLGALLRKRGDLDAAERHLREALSIRRKVRVAVDLDETSTQRNRSSASNNVAQTLNNLAGLLRNRGGRDALDQAEHFYRDSLRIREESLGPDHPDVGKVYNNLAKLYEDKGDDDAAEEAYQKALSILRTEHGLGEEHQYIARLLNSIAELRLKKGDIETAQRLCAEALAMQKKLLGDDHDEVAESRSLAERIAKAQQAPVDQVGNMGLK